MLLIFPSSAYFLNVWGCKPRNSTAFLSGTYAMEQIVAYISEYKQIIYCCSTSAPGRIGRRILFWWFFPGDDFLLCGVCGTKGGSCWDNGDCRGDSLRDSCASRLFACWCLCRRGRSA